MTELLYVLQVTTWVSLSLLCVSFPSVTEFSAIIFYPFLDQTQIILDHFNVLRTLRRNFNWIRQQMKNFPIDPHCKFKGRFRQRYNVFFYNGGLWGYSLPVVGLK